MRGQPTPNLLRVQLLFDLESAYNAFHKSLSH